ncbi:MAG: hypothetical protein Ct9H300mP21_07610 [Pseudomonadota bacterium]|nr:MAG: hypothetical protein Ct9H300mP21_07610 [Pseudomonadota bacterium]
MTFFSIPSVSLALNEALQQKKFTLKQNLQVRWGGWKCWPYKLGKFKTR